jgi:cytochrome c553
VAGEMLWKRRINGAFIAMGFTCALLSAADPLPTTSQGPASSRVCQQCHGTDGKGDARAKIPRLAGLAPDYLEKQLRDYKSGARDSVIMRNFAKPLNDADRAKLAEYFSALRIPDDGSQGNVSADQWSRGHELAHQGSEALRVQACDNCHGPDGSGVAFSAPKLTGQSAAYLITQIEAWQQGTRKNDAGEIMASVAKRLSDPDIAAVAAYFSSLERPP